MFSFVEPSASENEHERILAIEERIMAALELPYRVVDIPLGDLGAPAARKFDIEAWIPSQERYRELMAALRVRRLSPMQRPLLLRAWVSVVLVGYAPFWNLSTL